MSHSIKKKSKDSDEESRIRIEKPSQRHKPLKGSQSKKPSKRTKVTKSHKAIR